MKPYWGSGPATLTLVRHAESLGNVADTAAHDSDAEVLDLHERDADVDLSPTGHRQAESLRDWLRDRPDGGPDVVISSPYRRSLETARVALEERPVEIDVDERLRERDLGLFDGLTARGIRARFPEEAERRERLGKFYYQPPSGESWVDVVLRVRSLLRDLEHHDGADVWLFSHEAVIMAHRYVLEGCDEQRILELGRTQPLPNVSRTVYRRRGHCMDLETFADTSAPEEHDAPLTHEPGATT